MKVVVGICQLAELVHIVSSQKEFTRDGINMVPEEIHHIEERKCLA